MNQQQRQRKRLEQRVWRIPTVESTSRRFISNTEKPFSGLCLTCMFCYFADIQSCQTDTRVCCRTRHTVHWKASSSAMKRSSWPKDLPLSGNSRLHPTGRHECYSLHHNSHLLLFLHTGNPNILEALGWDVWAAHTGCLGRDQDTDNNSKEAENEGGSFHRSGRGHWHSPRLSGIPLPQTTWGSSTVGQMMSGCTARPSCISLAHKYCGCWTHILPQSNPRGKRKKNLAQNLFFTILRAGGKLSHANPFSPVIPLALSQSMPWFSGSSFMDKLGTCKTLLYFWMDLELWTRRILQ